MPASSNFNQAIREAQASSIVGPNVVQKALPYVGGGMVLTSLGVLAGISLIATNPGLFQPLSIVAIIAELVLFFIATSAANNANNSKALPLLTGFSLLTGFTLSGIVALAIGTIGIGSVGTAALATGITFVIASYTGQRMSDSVGQALSGVVGLGLIGLLIAMFVQLIGGFFAPGVFGGSGFELMIAGFGTVLFVAMSFDERIRYLADEEISIGDYVLSGGEIPAISIINGLTRLLPGTLGDPESLVDESHNSSLLEYPHYTRPLIFKGMKVPDILVSGNHEEIKSWRRQKSIERTLKRRSDLISNEKDKNSKESKET